MTDQRPIVINNNGNATEVINLLGTIIIFGGVGAVVWTVAQQGYAEIAASGFSVMLVQMVKMLLDAGVLAKPKKDGKKQHFSSASADVRRWAAEFEEWRADRTIWQMAGLAFGYAVGFLVLRAGVVAALGIFHNIVFAIGSAAIVGGVIAAPSWYQRYRKPAVEAGIYNPDALKGAPQPSPAPVYQAPVAPAPQPSQTQPVYDAAPQPIHPQQPAAPAPAPTTRRVVRRVVKKETPDA
ncbi:hypothetical protein LH935_14930 [Gordonia polyisoprenivorans]|uniref:hypothetical protein n=1 Tax=Gordonia polyisoprenivorans TaxID=84595 RepID=UPI0022345C08|nr:hypothetical protein LH935_14930 [Gordonia polyisoprenivorans]